MTGADGKGRAGEAKMPREAYIDICKAFGMLLVVFIHIKQNGPLAGGSAGVPVASWMDNFVCCVAMSVFFVMSGFLSQKMIASGDWRKLLVRAVVVVWPVIVVFGVVDPAVALAVGTPWKLTLVSYVRYLLSAGWFFGCLVLCDVVSFLTCRISGGRTKRFAAVLLGVYLLFWSLPVGLFHVVEMIPFYWFGLLGYRRLHDSAVGTTLGIVAFLVTLAVCSLVGDFFHCGLCFHYASMHLLQFTWRGFGLMAVRILLGLAGALGVMTVFRLAVKRLPALERLAWFGTETLGVFFVHAELLMFFLGVGWFGWQDGGDFLRMAFALMLFVFSHLLVIAINCSRWLRALIWNPFLLKRK